MQVSIDTLATPGKGGDESGYADVEVILMSEVRTPNFDSSKDGHGG